MKFFKKFKNKSDYNAYMKNIKVVLPNISYIVENEDVKFNKKKESTNYIIMTASAAQTVTAPTWGVFEYSYDKKNWNSMSEPVEFGTSGKEAVYVRGMNTGGIGSTFKFGEDTSMVSISGNCMALLNHENLPTVVPEYGFAYLFYGATPLKSVSTDFLPSMELSICAYTHMFTDCVSLVDAPALPSLSIKELCYANMFAGCSSLVKAPVLPAETLAKACYWYMFSGCTALTEIRCYATDITPPMCTEYWVAPILTDGDFYGKAIAHWGAHYNGIPPRWRQHLS